MYVKVIFFNNCSASRKNNYNDDKQVLDWAEKCVKDVLKRLFIYNAWKNIYKCNNYFFKQLLGFKKCNCAVIFLKICVSNMVIYYLWEVNDTVNHFENYYQLLFIEVFSNWVS